MTDNSGSKNHNENIGLPYKDQAAKRHKGHAAII